MPLDGSGSRVLLSGTTVVSSPATFSFSFSTLFSLILFFTEDLLPELLGVFVLAGEAITGIPPTLELAP